MSNFKPGDKVKIKSHPVDNWAVGKTGVVYDPYVHPDLVFIQLSGYMVTACAPDEIEKVES